MARALSLVCLVLLALAPGCGGGTREEGPQDGSAQDGGSGHDGGATDDTGAIADDTGTPMDDTGTPETDAGSPCGDCPSGTTCGSANGLPVCRAASGIPRFTNVTVIVMENTSLSTLMGASNTPYLSMLASSTASSSDYHGITHPSMPNYLALVSGMDASHIGCDCDPTGSACTSLTCNRLLHSCGCPQTVMHIGDQLDAAGLSWRDYGEDMGAACNTATSGSYAARHVPFLYFPNVQTDAARCAAHVVDYGAFDPEGDAQDFAFVAPNLVHDMHDPFPAGAANLANGDAWLSSNVPPILASTRYQAGGLLVIVWDEDDLSGGITGSTNDPIPMFVLSPYARSGGYVSTTRADHYALLATIEDGLGLPRLGQAASATPLVDFFPDL